LIQKRPQIANEILKYLAANPEAQDTLEGIVNWWLMERTIKQHTRSVKEALADLVDAGLVLAEERRGSSTRYRLNSKKRKKILSLLRKQS
jgi:DNA-binding transcriptional ArsR family regulator